MTDSSAQNGQCTSPPPRFEGKPYLQCLDTLEDAFPALKSFLEKLANEGEAGRQAVRQHYEREHQRTPGRCYCLEFKTKSVVVVEEGVFETADALRAYLRKKSASKSREEMHKRLFILEDMEPDYVDALGHYLGVDPLVFSEQMNTWNFTDSWSIPHRGLPSMSIPGQSFTLRYYELRTLLYPSSVDVLSLQTSFAVNRRRYERWKDIDIPSLGKPDRRHAFVRRCASFWTSQNFLANGKTDGLGWDAVLLVDPAFAATCKEPSAKSADGSSTAGKTESECRIVGDIKLDSSTRKTLDDCLILQAKEPFDSRSALWRAQDWGASHVLRETSHQSWPYHNGCSTLAPLMFSEVGLGTKEVNFPVFKEKRNLTSAMNEMVFYWTKLATPELVQETNEKSSNAAYYLLKHVAQHWVNQLELMNTTIARGEWFSDDYQAQIDDNLSKQKWKADLLKINEIAEDINYMRRHLNHFWRAMYLNLERLGVQLGCESVDANASLAIRDAQKDFLTLHTRMQPLRDRAEALNSVSNDLANLRAAFRGVSDGEFSLRLSLFASIVFPLTLLAGIFSMGDGFRPGGPYFWQLWAIGIPVCVVVALGLVYGRRPWAVFTDIWEYARSWLEHYELMKPKDEKSAQNRKREGTQKQQMKESKSDGQATLMRRAGWSIRDEEHGIDD
ncbi:hypothetical protein BKA58DRAFT_434317 [Alternaria rosae]|uniref:uncharacterized protein n=1 Tax=Alternaria rosae TaxID=1187941 RepID=UPI001E8CF204|nr:uncharacterized protein BKA58DRAFT_434317 [Alternaria rosae]KAH6882557.1 hypothetical protein BKA58DRAFT_434317 [Alternaria rosae]